MTKRVLVVGGSEEYTGAVYLAGISALRSGAESVIVMAPEKVAWAINSLSPDLVTRKLKGKYLSKSHLKTILKQLETGDVMILGNGATTRADTTTLMLSLALSSILKVIDADALKVLKGSKVKNSILTPNTGEWKLLKENNNINKLLKNGNVIIKKGNPTQILSVKSNFKVRANRGLDKAGTGDVLAGLCAGYLAQGFSLLESAKEATRVGNTIANILTKKKMGYYFLGSDIVEELKKIKSLKSYD